MQSSDKADASAIAIYCDFIQKKRIFEIGEYLCQYKYYDATKIINIMKRTNLWHNVAVVSLFFGSIVSSVSCAKDDNKTPDPLVPIDLKAVAASLTAEGEFSKLALASEAGDTLMLSLDANKLSEGEIAVEGEQGKKIIESGSFFRPAGGDPQSILSGKANIGVKPGDAFSAIFSGSFILDSGTELILTSDVVSPVMLTKYVLTAAEIMYYGITDDKKNSLFCIYVKDFPKVQVMNGCIYATVPLIEGHKNGDTSDLILPDGEYVSAPGTYEPFTFNDKDAESMKGFWYDIDSERDPIRVTHYVKSGKFTVSRSGKYYKMAGTFMETDTEGIIFEYAGEPTVDDYSY